MKKQRTTTRERLAATAWFDVVGIGLILATVVYSPLLYAWAHDVDVWQGWVIDVVAVTLPLVVLGAWLLAEHFRNVASDLEARRRRAEHAAQAADLDRATAWCTPDLFAAAVDRAIAALPAGYVRELETRNVGITTDDIDAERPYALGLYRRYPDRAEIVLFRITIALYARAPAYLDSQVADTLLHEVGHAFGMTEADLNRYSIGNQPVDGAIRVRSLDDPAP
jgi:predicted Zn-dependent protease with MMP-like domain